MLWAFFDESGKLADADFLCLCGYVAGDSWENFSSSWGDILKREGLPFLHTAQLFGQFPPYEKLGWNDQRIASVMDALARCVSQNILAGLGVAVDARHYRKMSPRDKGLIGGRTPEIFLFYRLMKKIIQVLETWNDPHPISLNFDWTEDFSTKCLKPLMHLVRNRSEIRTRISSIGFANDEVYYPLQAADMLCYGTKLSLEGRPPSYYKILTEGEPGFPPVHSVSEYYNSTSLDRLCSDLRAKLPPSAAPPAIVVALPKI